MGINFCELSRAAAEMRMRSPSQVRQQLLLENSNDGAIERGQAHADFIRLLDPNISIWLGSTRLHHLGSAEAFRSWLILDWHDYPPGFDECLAIAFAMRSATGADLVGISALEGSIKLLWCGDSWVEELDSIP
jgi:hypothetical protein